MNARSGCYNLRDGDFSANLPASEDRTPVLPPLIIVKAIRTTVRHANPTSPAPSGARFCRECGRNSGASRHASSPVPSSPKTLNRGPFEIHVAYAVRFILPPFPLPRAQSFFLSRSISLPISLIPYAFVQPRVGPSGPPSALSYPRRSLAKAIPGIHQEPQFQVPFSPWRAECCFTSSRKVLSWRESQVYCTWREREKEKEGGGDERGQGGWLARTQAYIHTDEDRVACATKHL